MIAFASLLSALFVSTLAFAAPSKLDSDASMRTPQGARDPSKFHLVPENGAVRIVNDEVHLVDASGDVLHVAKNTAADTEPFPTGWTAYAQWINAQGAPPVSFFNTTWSVPPNPLSNDDQTVFLFNSLVPPESGAIIQSVLQWGYSAAGGGYYWSVASWYLVGEDTYFTEPVNVNVGQVLKGIITLISQSGSSYDYQSTFAGIPGTTFTALGSEELTWVTETLECYGIEQISDYPAGSTVFSGIYLETPSGPPSMTWQTINDTTDGIITTVNRDSPTNAEITIEY